MTLLTVAPGQSAWPMSRSSDWNRIDKGDRTLLFVGGKWEGGNQAGGRETRDGLSEELYVDDGKESNGTAGD